MPFCHAGLPGLDSDGHAQSSGRRVRLVGSRACATIRAGSQTDGGALCCEGGRQPRRRRREKRDGSHDGRSHVGAPTPCRVDVFVWALAAFGPSSLPNNNRCAILGLHTQAGPSRFRQFNMSFDRTNIYYLVVERKKGTRTVPAASKPPKVGEHCAHFLCVFASAHACAGCVMCPLGLTGGRCGSVPSCPPRPLPPRLTPLGNNHPARLVPVLPPPGQRER
jgi:hypothetical protein